MKKLIMTMMVIFTTFSITHAQQVGTPNGNTAFFNTNAQGKLLGHRQTGVFGNFGGSDKWIGLGQPIPSAYGLRIQANGNAGILALTGTGSNKKLELNWGGPGKTADFEMNHISNFYTGASGKTKVFSITKYGNMTARGSIKSSSRTIYLGDVQKLQGNNSGLLKYSSNANTVSTLLMLDKQGTPYGYLSGQANGALFGLLDGDQQWGILMAKDNYTAFRINNSEKMRINSYGNVGIGTSNPGSYKLRVNGYAYATGSWVSSDKRYKKDVKNITNAMDKIEAIDGVAYAYKKEKINDIDFSQLKSGKTLGFIAQDIEKVFPELVKKDEDGYYAVNYDGMIPVLVEGIKEQQQVITDQKEKIEDLQSRMEKLEALFNASSEDIQGNFSLPAENTTTGIVLRQNAPNPFSNNTTIEYQLPDSIQAASLLISDLNGRTIATYSISGNGTVEFSAKGLDNGVYVYTIIANGKSIASQKMVVQK